MNNNELLMVADALEALAKAFREKVERFTRFGNRMTLEDACGTFERIEARVEEVRTLLEIS